MNTLTRRILIFGTGLAIGSVLAFGLKKTADENRGPAEVENIVVLVSGCDLEKGAVLNDECADFKTIKKQFVPPQTIPGKQKALFVGKRLTVKLSKGAAIRSVDFE